jgi:predicted nucleic acid-binding protein
MEKPIILVDTSILIDFYRKTNKENSVWIKFIRQGYRFAISTITKYEIYSGASEKQIQFWDEIFKLIEVIPFDEECVNTAVTINSALKKKRKQIDIADLFIASTAITYNMPIATLNLSHFERIVELQIIDIN